MLKILTIIGARPQFIKAASLSRKFKLDYLELFNEIIVHTGQHYDNDMSEIFFKQLQIPEPKYNLGVSNKTHGAMTGQMLEKLEAIFLKELPDFVLVYGDTNSTLSGALAASKLHIPVIHIEAGLRSFNKKMPEEINRIITDHLSSLLFCPTDDAVKNLAKENVDSNVYNVGDIMYDIALSFKDKINELSDIHEQLNLKKNGYALVTVHREVNTNNYNNLKEILTGLKNVSQTTPVIFPIHPRTKKYIYDFELNGLLESILTIPPVNFLDMMKLLCNSFIILTDSGGVQKEAYFYNKPCLTLRNETEWIETIEVGSNILVGSNAYEILNWFNKYKNKKWVPKFDKNLYGSGNTSELIINTILNYNKIN